LHASSGPAASGLNPTLHAAVQQAVDKALAFLAASQQPDGGWKAMDGSDPAITALVAKCFIQHPRYGPKHPIVRRAIEFVLRFRQKDGGIYPQGYGLRNYYTSVCLMMLAAAKDPALEPALVAARKFLQRLQWDEAEGIDRANAWYGGAGYGRHKRPDLSNTQMMLEALHQSGLDPNDPTYRKALVFITRCQMLSQTNDQPFARGADDGGFIYTPVGASPEQHSKAGQITIGGRRYPRSYGSMTYAGFKSMLYARVDRNDVRVRRALDWIRKHYTLDENPNMPGAQSLEGLFYYYHVFAKALAAWGEPVLIDAAGRRHNWRAELCRKLLALQRADGSWVNTAPRWMEDNPYLVTAYALLAIQTALK